MEFGDPSRERERALGRVSGCGWEAVFLLFQSRRAVWPFATTCYAIGSILLRGHRL